MGWAIRLAKRLESLHALGVAHGSVSPACILTDGVERTAKAYLADVQFTTSNAAFQSPERLLGGDLSSADDTWAVAATLYTVLTGKGPFTGANDAETRQRILAGQPAPLAAYDVGDDDLQHILDHAFARDAGARTATVSALRRALEEWHPDPSVGSLKPLDDEDSSADGDDLADMETVMRPNPVYPHKQAAVADEDDDDVRTVMREPPPSPAPLTAAASPRLAPGMGRPLPAAGRAGLQKTAPLAPFGAPKPAAPAPAPAHDDDDDDDVRTVMRAPDIADEDSMDVRTQMRDPAAPEAWAPPPGPGGPPKPGPWTSDPLAAKTLAFQMDELPAGPPRPIAGFPGGGSPLGSVVVNPQAVPPPPGVLGPPAAFGDGSAGGPRPWAPGPQGPHAPQGPQGPAPNASMVSPWAPSPVPGPGLVPAPPPRKSRAGMVIAAVLALVVAAAITFVLLYLRGAR